MVKNITSIRALAEFPWNNSTRKPGFDTKFQTISQLFQNYNISRKQALEKKQSDILNKLARFKRSLLINATIALEKVLDINAINDGQFEGKPPRKKK